MKTDELVTDEQMQAAFANTNFGSADKRELIKYGVLKAASGYPSGHTLTIILHELDLVNSTRKGLNLTKRGKEYLWECFGKLGE